MHKSLNTLLADAVANVAVANDSLAKRRETTRAARIEEAAAINHANEMQKKFDELVMMVKKSAPHDTDWKRPASALN